jgi:uncharacterized protein YhjY with autotransporter beta-barrel domain
LSDVAGLTLNQLSLATYLDDICMERRASNHGGFVCSELHDPALPVDQVHAALDAITSAPLFGAAHSAIEVTAIQNNNVMQRIAALRSGARGAELSGFNLQTDGQHIGGDVMNAAWRPTLGRVLDGVLRGADGDDRLGLFLNGTVRRGNAKELDSNVGLTTGIDYRLSDSFALGTSLGYTNMNVENDPSRGAMAIESWRGTLFGTYYKRDFFHIDGLIAYANSAFDSQRRITFDDVQAVAQSAGNGRQVSGALTSAIDLKHGPWTFGPHAGAYLLKADVAALDEFGAGDYDLTVGSQHAQSARLNAGARLAAALRTPWGVLTPHISADYVHDLADGVGAVDVRFARLLFASSASASQAAVGLRMDPPEAGYFVWSVGASAQLARAVSGFVDYRSFASADNLATNELSCGVRFQAGL